MKGAGGGGKRRSRKPTRVESDDRPRGFEATRMRQLWRDIDDAKQKAGLGRKEEPPPAAGWDISVGTVIAAAATLIESAATWVTASAPAALALLVTGAELLRGVPVVGRLAELMPPAEPPPSAPEPRPLPSGHTNGTNPGARDPDEITDPDGGWLH